MQESAVAPFEGAYTAVGVVAEFGKEQEVRPATLPAWAIGAMLVRRNPQLAWVALKKWGLLDLLVWGKVRP